MTIKRFAGIVGTDIFTVTTIDSDNADSSVIERLVAGFSSNPTFVEIPDNLNVTIAWTWNGTEFVEN
jgi:hypothetical protein